MALFLGLASSVLTGLASPTMQCSIKGSKAKSYMQESYANCMSSSLRRHSSLEHLHKRRAATLAGRKLAYVKYIISGRSRLMKQVGSRACASATGAENVEEQASPLMPEEVV
jgi:hypothetical protein